MDELLREISLTDRRGTDSLKWDGMQSTFGRGDLLPMWVADMDFKTPSCVRQALHEAVDQGAFGYYQVPESYYDSILSWELSRHGTRWARNWIRFTNGVVSGLYHLLQAITGPGDGVLIQTPVYYPFYRVIQGLGRRGIFHPLREENGVYTVDLDGFEKTISREKPAVFLLCSPHNPVGRVWTEKELTGMLDCCRRYGVQVVSDEIHHDLILPGHHHHSAASLWDGAHKPITFFSPSKTFNLAGMKHSVLMIPEEEQRRRFDAFEARLGAGESSTLDYIAAGAAYAGGESWLNAVLREIAGNAAFLRETLWDLPGVVLSPLEGTYLLWMDFRGVVVPERLPELMQDVCGVAPDYGKWFYPERNDPGAHIRLNLAAPAQTIQEAARRLKQGIQAGTET